MNFATVFAFALFAFVAQTHANPLLGSIELDVDIVKKEIAVNKEKLQGLVSKETVVVLDEINKNVDKARAQANVATKKLVDNIEKIAVRVDALKREATEANKELQNLIVAEQEIVNVLIKKVSVNVVAQIGGAAEIVLDKVCKLEDRIKDILIIESKKGW